MKKGYIYAALLGGAFFAVPYLAVGLEVLPSAVMGVAAYGAGLLLLKDRNSQLAVLENNQAEWEKQIEAAKENVEKLQMVGRQLEDPTLVKNVEEIRNTANKIIQTLQKNPEKVNSARNFLNYYLPVTIKILTRYDEIENQKLNTQDSVKFMTSIQNMVAKIKEAFIEQLNNMYQREMIDTDAEIQVFETMLKSDGFLNDIDFQIEEKNRG